MRNILFIILLCISFTTWADNITNRFQSLTKEIRCVVCQNQSIADSEAPLAHDLRIKVQTMLAEGKSDTDIKNYLVARYGEFILFKPRFNYLTWFLWLFPIMAIGIFFYMMKRFFRTS